MTPFDLTCWYLNLRRVAELTGPGAIRQGLADAGDQMERLRVLAHAKRSLIDWLHATTPPTVGQLITRGELTEGAVVTHTGALYCKDLSKWSRWRRGGRVYGSLPYAHASLADVGLDARLKVPFHPEHLTSNSSWSELSGRKRLFVLGLVTGAEAGEVIVTPWAIASVLAPQNAESPISARLVSRLEIHADEIDSFALARECERPRKRELELLREISEEQVKMAFAEIIGEENVPKDWGGERSDLLTCQVELGGSRISAAFAFKGPAKFRRMTMASLGKNGDQIERLFTEPADLLFLQHCHEIDRSVRATMRAFAHQAGNLRLFCLIDGYDTLRILRSYKKCGMGPDG